MTGFCIYRVYVRRERDGYVLHRVTANRSKKQFKKDNDERDAVLVAILIGQALGKDVSGLWGRFFEFDGGKGLTTVIDAGFRG